MELRHRLSARNGLRRSIVLTAGSHVSATGSKVAAETFGSNTPTSYKGARSVTASSTRFSSAPNVAAGFSACVPASRAWRASGGTATPAATVTVKLLAKVCCITAHRAFATTTKRGPSTSNVPTPEVVITVPSPIQTRRLMRCNASPVLVCQSGALRNQNRVKILCNQSVGLYRRFVESDTA